jgi:hypothetical protein
MKARLASAFLLAAVVATNLLFAADSPQLMTWAHAHNDYEHARPLLDALDHGFCSVEADIYLVQGKLLVGHTLLETRAERTLQNLYLQPLRERIMKNGGRVYRGGPEFTLLIDLKQDWRILYPVLRGVLTNYADMLVSFRDGEKQTNAIMVIITGERDKIMFNGETTRYAAYDGAWKDLEENPPASLVPWISADWKSRFHWRGSGAIPEKELNQLRETVKKTHEQGRRLRFWNAPDNPTFWRAVHSAGVDLINTDDLAGADKFFNESTRQ